MPTIHRDSNDPYAARYRRPSLVLAPSPKDFEHSTDISSWMFDKGRRSFTMTNGGLSLNAELFMSPPHHADYEPLYLVQLNCCRSWPPIIPSPLVLFLRDAAVDSDSSGSAKIPLFFLKLDFPPQTWRAADFGQWKSLGRHNILVSEERAKLPNYNYNAEKIGLNFTEKFPSTIDVRHRLVLTDRYTMQWAVEDMSVLPVSPTWLTELEAYICLLTVKSTTPTNQDGYLVVVKWNQWNRQTLSCGVWLLQQMGSIKSLPAVILKHLTCDKNQPYPTTAPCLPQFRISKDQNQVMGLKISPIAGSSHPRHFFIALVPRPLQVTGSHLYNIENVLPRRPRGWGKDYIPPNEQEEETLNKDKSPDYGVIYA